MRLQFNLMTHTEQSSIRVIPVLDQQSNTPLLFSTPKARPKASSRDQHTQEQHRRTPRGKIIVTKSSNTGEINLSNFEGKQPKKFSFRPLIRKLHTKNFMQCRSS